MDLKLNMHSLGMLLLFAASCLNSMLLLAWLIIIPIWLIFTYGKSGAIEFFIYLQFRSLLSTGVAVPIAGNAAIIKWIVIFGLSFYLLIGRFSWITEEIKSILNGLLLFSVVVVISSFFVCSYPLVSMFKVFAYIVPFIAIIVGVYQTRQVDYMHMINSIFEILIIGSAFVYPLSIGYMINRSFQGLFNHPNMLGIMMPMFVAGYFYEKKRITLSCIITTVICFTYVYLSQSRTGMISLLVILIVFLFKQEISLNQKILFTVLVALIMVLVLTLDDSVINISRDFLLKGQKENLFVSRAGQITNNTTRFLASPIFGTGLNVPYIPGERSYQFTFDLIAENGNLFMALLADTGIIGLISFVLAYFRIFLKGKGNLPTIFFAPFLVSLGEMAFFSTNNCAIIYYLYFAIYISDINQIEEASETLL